MCLCGKQIELSTCCGIYLDKNVPAPSAEHLMRSRYSAFVVKNIDYLLRTHNPETRKHFDVDLNRDWAHSVHFIKLEIIKSEEIKNKGIVEFIAHFEDIKSKNIYKHHELSEFIKIKGQWYYSFGQIIES